MSNPDCILLIPALTQNRDEIFCRFMDNMTVLLNELAAIEIRKEESVNFDTLSLLQEDVLEVIYSKTFARRSGSSCTNEMRWMAGFPPCAR